jgi:hypothetical protein
MQVLERKTSGAGSPGPLMSQMILAALPSFIVYFQAAVRAPNLICIVSCLGLHFEKEDWPNDRVEPMRSYRNRGGGRTGAGSWELAIVESEGHRTTKQDAVGHIDVTVFFSIVSETRGCQPQGIL